MTTPLLIAFAASIFVASFALIAWNTRRGLRFRERPMTAANTVVPAVIGAAISTGLTLPPLLGDTPHLLLAIAWGTMSAALLANVITDLLDHDVWVDVVFVATAIVVVLSTLDALLVPTGNRQAPDAIIGMLVLGALSYGLQRGAGLWARVRGLKFEEGDEDSDYGFGDTAAWLLIGAGLGWQLGLMAFFGSAILHGLLAIPVLVWSLAAGRGWFSTHIPMLPSIAAATLVALAYYGGLLKFILGD